MRHPFSRLYSAWNDKFRHGVFLEEMGNISGHRWKQTMERKEQYLDVFYPTISIFEEENIAPPLNRNVTFQAFLKYVATFPDDELHFDWHWRSYNYFCSPCMFSILDIIHMEDLKNESDYVFNEKWKLPHGFHLPVDYTSPEATLERKPPRTKYYQTVPKETVIDLYRIYYHDLVMFGFSPESVLEFYNAAMDETNVTNNKKSRARTEIKPFANSMKTLWPEEDWKMCNEALWHNDTVLLSQLFVNSSTCQQSCSACNCSTVRSGIVTKLTDNNQN